MRISNIHIKSFGSLSNVDLKLSPGINVVFGKNESGKSTITSFVRFILYGFQSKAERESYTANASGTVSGWLVIQSETGENYRIERDCSSAAVQHVQVISLKNGAIVSKSKEPGAILLGISSQLFTKSSFISQSDGPAPDRDGLNSAIENLLFSADENLNTQKALDKLDKARAYLHHKNRQIGKIPELESELSDEKQRLDSTFETNKSLAEVSVKLDDARIKLENIRVKNKKLNLELTGLTAFTRLKVLREIKKLAQVTENEGRELDSLRESYSYNGFLPNSKYLDELKRLKSEHDLLISDTFSQNIGSSFVNADAQSVSPNPELEQQAEKLASLGGRNGILDRCHNLLKLEKSKKSHYTISFVLCLILIVVGALTCVFADNKALCAIPFGLAVICGIFCIYSLASMRSSLSVLHNFYNSFHVSDENALTAYLDDFYNSLELARQKSAEASARENARVSIARENELAKAEKLKKNEEDAARLLAMYGCGDLDSAISLISARRDELDDKAARIAKLGERLNHLSEAVRASENISEETLFSKAYLEQLTADLDASGLSEDELLEYSAPDSPKADALKRELDFSSKAADSLDSRVRELETEEAVLSSKAVDAAPIADRISQLESELDGYRTRYDAILLATEKLSAASENLRSGISPRLSSDAGSFLNIATAGKYRELGVSPSLDLSYNPDGTTRPDDFMSTGTKDVAYFCLRLALMNLICREEKPPVICDEVFARLDDERLASMFRLLSGLASADVQSIVFTCQKRESELLKQLTNGADSGDMHKYIEL